ncbi:hypothetical protein EAF04_009507 [Stromatinia cepivora]|nr:hypothetical protein EAF04_009507 [Stromatinia cepivora]
MGIFRSMIKDPYFQCRCKFVAIDELHIYAKDNWGGSFRQEFAQLKRLYLQLNDDAVLFGITVTLTLANEMEIKKIAGFKSDVIVRRTSVYRPDVFIKMIPISLPINICRQFIHTALTDALSKGLNISKMIFYVKEVNDTFNFMDNIINWLRLKGQLHTNKIVKVYHGQLTDEERKSVEQEFAQGTIRIIIATPAYAFGVNPPAVKYIIQIGRDTLVDQLQKLGRAVRGGLLNGEGGCYLMLPQSKVAGPRRSEIPHEDLHNWIGGRRRNERLLPGQMTTITMEEFSQNSDNGGSQPSQIRRQKKEKPTGQVPDIDWRDHMLTDFEYDYYNTGCIWDKLLASLGEPIPGSKCDNCSRCRPDAHLLLELNVGEESQPIEDEEKIKIVERDLEVLAEQLGKLVPTLRASCNRERVLPERWRKLFSKSCLRVAKGNVFGWPWEDVPYKIGVVNCVRKSLGMVFIRDDNMVDFFGNVEPLPPPASIQLSTFQSRATSAPTTTKTPSVSRIGLREMDPNIRRTPRGDLSSKKHINAIGKDRKRSFRMYTDDK